MRTPYTKAVAQDLIHARVNLALAAGSVPPYAHLCFHAEQAAQNALRAVLASQGPSVTHGLSLEELVELVPRGLAPAGLLESVKDLSVFALWIISPSERWQVRQEQYRHALSLARDVVAWAERVVLGGLPHGDVGAPASSGALASLPARPVARLQR